MSSVSDLLVAKTSEYVAESRRLSGLTNTTEETFYPAIRDLLMAILRDQTLPFEVRTGTSESKQGGTDRPDFVLADAALFVGVFGEVKKPDVSVPIRLMQTHTTCRMLPLASLRTQSTPWERR